MSIATARGDGGQTGLAGGIRVSKADLRVETYGTVDELNSVLGFARSICSDKQVAASTEQIQRTLFLSDWSLPGAHPESAAFEIARTVCRRAERHVVRFVENGGVVHLRFSLTLIVSPISSGRLIEHKAGIDASLRENTKAGPRWWRAW